MSFKGEIALGALNSKYKYGFTIGDIYRVQGAGNLVPNNLAVANGAFVEWTSNGWEVKKDMQYAVSKTGESLDDAAVSLEEEVFFAITEAVGDVQSIIDNTPNIKNVQPDWNAASGDAAIKNKPFYRKYTGSASYYKICTMPKSGSSSTEMYGFEFAVRKYNGGIYGIVLYKNTLKTILNSVSNISIDADYVRLYAFDDDINVTIYARALGYVSLEVAPLINFPKANVDFTEFGTAVSGLPEGATEITSVWSATSTGSSEYAPVKVNEYGLLSPVTMDAVPTEGSSNLMTSGAIKTALDQLSVRIAALE